MDSIASNLKLSETKQRSLAKSHEKWQAQADSMLIFSARWSDLEEHFNSIRSSLHAEFEKLGDRRADLEAKESELLGIEHEVQESKSQLQSLKLLVKEYCEKAEVEENRLRKLHSNQQLMSKEIEFKERQLYAVRVKVEEQWKEFDSIDEQIREKRTLVEEYDREIKSKERKLGLVKKLMVEYSNGVESKTKDFCSLEALVKEWPEWDCQLELKEKEIKRWVEKLEEHIESKFEELNLIDKRVNDCLDEVQLKEKHLDSREKHLDSLEKSIYERLRRVEQHAKELELNQQEVDLAKKSAQEQTQEQNPKENTVILSQVKIEHLEHNPDNIVLVPYFPNNQSRINRDGRNLQSFLNDYFRRTDLVSVKVSACLQLSSDPARLVLDAMQGFYPSNSTVENRDCDFDLSVIRRSCIHLLKELKRVSPQINVQVREEAKKLACDWKDKMIVAAENWLEVLGFLWLLNAYDLTFTYDADERRTLFRIAAEHEQLAELCGVLDIADEAPVRRINGAPIGPENPDSSLIKNAATFSSPNFQLAATTDGRNLQGLPNDHLSGNHLLQNENFKLAMYGLISTLNEDGFIKLLGMIFKDKQALENFRFHLGDRIPQIIPKFVERKRVIEAVRVICTFNLMEEFPAVPILKEYVEDAMKCCRRTYKRKKSYEDKDKVVDEQIADLKAVIQCIKDYNLEAEYLSRDIEKRISMLHKIQEDWRRCAASLASNDEQVQKKRKNCSTSTSAPEFHNSLKVNVRWQPVPSNDEEVQKKRKNCSTSTSASEFHNSLKVNVS